MTQDDEGPRSLSDPTTIIARACAAISSGAPEVASGAPEVAATILRSELPFQPVAPTRRRRSLVDAARIFRRDGFVDRYTGRRVILPGAMRLLSIRLPDAFPYQRNWRADSCHQAWWTLCATIDHAIPISRGGADTSSNWVTTAMATNAAKANAALGELPWTLRPLDDPARWDGLATWFLAETARDRTLLRDPGLRLWARAVVLADNP